MPIIIRFPLLKQGNIRQKLKLTIQISFKTVISNIGVHYLSIMIRSKDKCLFVWLVFNNSPWVFFILDLDEAVELPSHIICYVCHTQERHLALQHTNQSHSTGMVRDAIQQQPAAIIFSVLTYTRQLNWVPRAVVVKTDNEKAGGGTKLNEVTYPNTPRKMMLSWYLLIS